MKAEINPAISTACRKLLQSLNTPNAFLTLDTENRLWMRDRKPLKQAEEKAAKEALKLCLFRTDSKSPWEISYKLSREALKVLLDPNYVPTILRAKSRA